MRPRTEAALALGAVVVLLVAAGVAGARRGSALQVDGRPSTYLPDPYGSRGFAEALQRLGTTVERWRRPLRRLGEDSTVTGRSLLVLLDPTWPLAPGEVASVLAWAGQGGRGLMLAGPGAEAVMRCFGYAVSPRSDSVRLSRVTGPMGPSAPTGWPRIAAVLAKTTEPEVIDSSRISDAVVTRCEVPALTQATPLLETRTGRLAGVRLARADTDGEVLLFSDAGPFRNLAMRHTPSGEFVLGWVAGRYRRVLFDERSHGFGEGGSLAAATLDWSRRSPWGWAAWQAFAVGLLALAATAVRFGQPSRLARGRRRSPLEHVRALATALAAAKGHDVAIGLIVQGLRRRLGGRPAARRGDWREWVATLPRRVTTARAREAQAELLALSQPGQPPVGVLRAANAVEDLWEALHR